MMQIFNFYSKRLLHQWINWPISRKPRDTYSKKRTFTISPSFMDIFFLRLASCTLLNCKLDKFIAPRDHFINRMPRCRPCLRYSRKRLRIYDICELTMCFRYIISAIVHVECQHPLLQQDFEESMYSCIPAKFFRDFIGS